MCLCACLFVYFQTISECKNFVAFFHLTTTNQTKWLLYTVKAITHIQVRISVYTIQMYERVCACVCILTLVCWYASRIHVLKHLHLCFTVALHYFFLDKLHLFHLCCCVKCNTHFIYEIFFSFDLNCNRTTRYICTLNENKPCGVFYLNSYSNHRYTRFHMHIFTEIKLDFVYTLLYLLTIISAFFFFFFFGKTFHNIFNGMFSFFMCVFFYLDAHRKCTLYAHMNECRYVLAWTQTHSHWHTKQQTKTLTDHEFMNCLIIVLFFTRCFLFVSYSVVECLLVFPYEYSLYILLWTCVVLSCNTHFSNTLNNNNKNNQFIGHEI